MGEASTMSKSGGPKRGREYLCLGFPAIVLMKLGWDSQGLTSSVSFIRRARFASELTTGGHFIPVLRLMKGSQASLGCGALG